MVLYLYRREDAEKLSRRGRLEVDDVRAAVRTTREPGALL